MANSKYRYVREFEAATDQRLLPQSYVVVRVDGQSFHRFSKEHSFLKPNDKRCLDLMNKSALHVMRTFYPNIVFGYGQSDEYSFVIRKFATIFNRRAAKISSLITSAFTSAFVYYWPQFFNSEQNSNLIMKPYNEYNKNQSTITNEAEGVPSRRDTTWNSIKLKYPPSFDGRCVIYPTEQVLTDYMRWRQVDCHINNLYNTSFYALTGEYTRYIQRSTGNNSIVEAYTPFTSDHLPLDKKYYNHQDATKQLSGTNSGDKNNILFETYDINYNNELEQFRKGTVLVLNPPEKTKIEFDSTFNKPATEVSTTTLQKRCKKFESDFSLLSSEEQETYFLQLHCDIIQPTFWEKYGHLLQI